MVAQNRPARPRVTGRRGIEGGQISEPRTRDAIWEAIGHNREHNIKNDEPALEAYASIVDGRTHIGGASEFTARQGIARILTRKGQFDEALKMLNRAKPDKLQGVWRTNIQKSIGAVNKTRKQP